LKQLCQLVFFSKGRVRFQFLPIFQPLKVNPRADDLSEYGCVGEHGDDPCYGFHNTLLKFEQEFL